MTKVITNRIVVVTQPLIKVRRRGKVKKGIA